MNIVLDELMAGLPDPTQMASLAIRLLTAMFLGAIVGIQRERQGKPAGLRTHMLVAMGAALFVLGSLQSGMNSDEISRVIQGLITGIGFIGAGAILKLEQKREIEGLTTAAGIWMTAAIGVAVGLGRLGLAMVSTLATWITLALVRKLEQELNEKQTAQETNAAK
jgi:putative Mg2+ transporter-C (MgtC) family protein